MKKGKVQADLFEWAKVKAYDDVVLSDSFSERIRENELHFERGQDLLHPDHKDSFVQLHMRSKKAAL